MAPLLYSIVSEDTLHSMVDTFYACMRLPIQVIDEHGELFGCKRTDVQLLPLFPGLSSSQRQL